MNVDIETIPIDHLSVDHLDQVTSPFVCLCLPGVLIQPVHTTLLAMFLRQHPDYAAAAPRLLNRQGQVVTSWSDRLPQGLLGRFDARVAQLASAPLSSRDAAVLSCAALVADTEELLATLEDTEPTDAPSTLCWRLAQRWNADDRRLRWCGDIKVEWETDALVAPDLPTGR